MRVATTILMSLLIVPVPLLLRGSQKQQQPRELGTVPFLRDLDEGLAQAKRSGKPVFLQFQEVPG